MNGQYEPINELKEAKIRLLKGQVQRTEDCIRAYENLIEYWTGPRIIGKTRELNQNREFLTHQTEHCKEMLSYHKVSLAAYRNGLDEWSRM